MKQLAGKVAVVTGGASGIGYAMAERFAAEGMKLVLADIEQEPLDAAVGKLSAAADVIGVRTDVAEADQMDALGEATLSRFGAVHVVCNNAGVANGGPMWELTTRDWEWVMRVNLWGVIHGVRVFVPHLVAQNEGHVVNTASLAGMLSIPGMGPYNVTKHGVVTLSETLSAELRDAGKNVGVSVLCPGFVDTRILDSERNRPDSLQNEGEPQEASEVEEQRQAMAEIISQGMPPSEVAERVLDAIVSDRLYILTHPGSEDSIERRMKAIMEGRNPDLQLPEEAFSAGKW